MTTTDLSAIRLVPASLFRIRSFLGRRGGLKIRPWLGVEQALDEFSRALGRHEQDDRFWSELEELLGALTADLGRRLTAEGKVVDNELLAPEEHRALLAEIRRALAVGTAPPARYRELSGVLGARAAGLLAVLGSVAALGCGGATSESNAVTDAGADQTAQDASDASVDTGIIHIDTDASRDAPTDTPLPFDAECQPDGADLTTLMLGCLSAMGLSSEAQVTDCVRALNDAWRAGMTQLFACTDCQTLTQYLNRNGCGNYFCSRVEYDAAVQGDGFDLQTLLDSVSGCPVYVGVRFD
jgi:hypothetical protein